MTKRKNELMKYRKMGKHDIKLSEISIGTMYHGSYIKKDAALACLTEAVNQGINFIDCADRYGIDDSELPMDQRTRAEIILGEFLRGQQRDDLVVSSKVFKQLRESPNSGGLSRKHIRESIRDSLKYLQENYKKYLDGVIDESPDNGDKDEQKSDE